MPLSDEDEIELELRYEVEAGISPELWQIQKYLQDHQEDFGLEDFKKLEQGLGSTYSTQECLQFNMIMNDGNSRYKCAYTTGNPIGYSLHLQDLTDTKELQSTIKKFNEMVYQNELKFHPANQELKLNVSGDPRLVSLAKKLLRDQNSDYSKKLNDRGIGVSVDGETYFSPKEADEGPKRASIFSIPKVPRGAPDKH